MGRARKERLRVSRPRQSESFTRKAMTKEEEEDAVPGSKMWFEKSRHAQMRGSIGANSCPQTAA